jgi:aminopeptidase N
MLARARTVGHARAVSHRLHERCGCRAHQFSQAGDARGFVLAGTQRVYERPRPFSIEHIALDLALDHGEQKLEGTATLRFSRVSAEETLLRLDAVSFEIASVELRSRRGGGSKRWHSIAHVYDGEWLDVTIPKALEAGEVRVAYSARPRRGMYFMAPDKDVPHRVEEIWTQCQDEDARHIFPCHDKPHVKQTFEVAVQARPGWTVLSNGDLVGPAAARKKGHFRYKMDQRMPSYLFTLVAGAFDVIEDAVGDLPVTYLVPEGRKDDGRRTFANTPAMIALFAKKTGVAYPWTKYAQVVVQDFIFGGMENTGATTMYEHILLDDRAAIDVDSDDLIAHELAHQWFGDLVTCRDWSHAWLNEGFATFFEHVWREHHRGRDEYAYGLFNDLQAYLGESSGRYRRPVVCQDYQAPIDIFDRHLYEKGGLFLHSLREKLGEAVFWRGVKLYLERHAHGIVETRDLMRALEEVSGASLERDFEQGLFRATHPSLEVKIAYESHALAITVDQRLEKDETPFVLDLELLVAEEKGKPRPLRMALRDKSETFAFPLEKRPRWVAVDPELRIVGKIEVKMPADMLRRQLVDGTTGRVRALAAAALGKRDDVASIRALAEALDNARAFWGVRATAAQSLGRIRTAECLTALTKAAKTKDPKVRRAVASALGQFRLPEAAEILVELARRDPSLLVASAASRALGETRQPEAFDVLADLIDRESWADVLRVGAIAGLAKLRDERGIDLLRERTRYGIPNRGRRAAIGGLPALSTSRKTRELLEELFDDRDPHIRVSVIEALGELGDVKARGALLRQLERENDGRVRRHLRELLRDLAGKGRLEVRRLREQLDQLERSHAELKARVSKLEGRHDK